MKNKNADGLRGIAAFNVAIAHFVAAFLPAMLHYNYPKIFVENTNPSKLFEIFTSPFFTIFYNGRFAVLIFFVLSGYVLTLPYWTDAINAKLTLKKRVCGRYFRLNIPIFVAVFISYFIYKLGLYSNIQAAEISGSTNWLKSFYPPGITLIPTIKEAVYRSIFYGSSWLVPPLWTLKIEFIGSIYILLFYILKPQKYIFLPFLLIFCAIYAIHAELSIYYYAIFFGSLLSVVKMNGTSKFVAFTIGLYFGGFQLNSDFYNYLPSITFLENTIWEKKTFYNTIGAVLVTLTVVQGFGSRIFESKPAQFLGRISFSLYLLHFMVLCSMSCFVFIYLPQGNIYLILNLFLYLFICFIISIVFEKYVDKYAIDYSHKFSKKVASLSFKEL